MASNTLDPDEILEEMPESPETEGKPAASEQGSEPGQISDQTERAAETSEDEGQALEEKIADLEARLAEAEKKAEEYLDGWRRTQASFENFRKRTEAERAEWRSNANADLLARLLPILDDFRRAFEAVPAEYQEDPWLEGLRLVQRKLEALLRAENVTPIEIQPGDLFDPRYHEAVLYQEVEGFDEGQVVAEVERGHLLGERVLRPSLVVVAKAPTQPAEPATESADEEESTPQAGDDAPEAAS